MSSLGQRLRQERLQRGLSLEQAAKRTRISARFLEAIEAEEFDKLPGSFFARSFVRQYAAALGLDPEAFDAELGRFEEPVTPPPPPEPAQPRIRVPPIAVSAKARRLALRRWAGSVAAFVLVVLACAVLYTIWQKVRWAPAPQPQPPAAAPSPPATSAPPQPAPFPPPSAPEAPILIHIRASEDAWVRVTSDGRVVFSGVLKPGQTQAFQGRESLSLLTGNAGALQLAFNGRLLGPLGPRGQIRVVEFTPADYRILERKPPPAS